MNDREAVMEMVLPLLVTDVMHKLEAAGKHPEADFTERLRGALLMIITDYPQIQNDVWNRQKKEEILQKICAVISL